VYFQTKLLIFGIISKVRENGYCYSFVMKLSGKADKGNGIMSLNLPGGSTLQLGNCSWHQLLMLANSVFYCVIVYYMNVHAL